MLSLQQGSNAPAYYRIKLVTEKLLRETYVCSENIFHAYNVRYDVFFHYVKHLTQHLE